MKKNQKSKQVKIQSKNKKIKIKIKTKINPIMKNLENNMNKMNFLKLIDQKKKFFQILYANS